jgi:3D-(3,5/4)-trihydroxycyclohexane-1,2-dione acylhydrolase (decyclizing)
LQEFKGVPGFNNLIKDCRVKQPFQIDFVKNAESMGALARHCESLADLLAGLEWAQTTDRTTLLSIVTDAYSWVPGDADWDVGVPEVSARTAVNDARAHQMEIRRKQRIGV